MWCRIREAIALFESATSPSIDFEGGRYYTYRDLNEPPGWRFSNFRNILLHVTQQSWSVSLQIRKGMAPDG